MAPTVEQPRQSDFDSLDPSPAPLAFADVPGMMADRIGTLYAEEERRDRLARTERLIREAESLQERASTLGLRARSSDAFGELQS